MLPPVRRRTWFLAAIVVLAGPSRAASVQEAAVVPLRSGPKPINQTTADAFISRVRSARDGLHGFALLSHDPSFEERNRLTAQGVVVLSRVARTIYLVKARRDARFSHADVTSLIRYLAPSEPQDRVTPVLWNGDITKIVPPPSTRPGENPYIGADSTIKLVVRIHDDVAEADGLRVISALRRPATPYARAAWLVSLPLAAVRQLAVDDRVRWIDLEPVAGGPDLDLARETVHLSAVQTFDPNLVSFSGPTGKGVRVAVFEDFGIDAANSDFHVLGTANSRVIVNQATPGSHPTYVAGIIAGSGQNSDGTDSWNQPNGGAPHQWRGFAPEAELINTKKLVYGAGTYRDLIAGNAIALSNHSYSLGYSGFYGELNALHDAVIRGDYPDNYIFVVGFGLQPPDMPSRLHVHSAGNYGVRPSKTGGDYQRGYFSLGNQLKNALTVGDYSVSQNRPSTRSSLGPTYDGRIKPDLLAPSSFVKSVGYCTATDNPPYALGGVDGAIYPCNDRPSSASFPRRSFYLSQQGTSGAAAVASGILALVYQELRSKPPSTQAAAGPLPSTLRAIAIHSARDIIGDWGDLQDGSDGTLPWRAFEGPDFATGYGLIDAEGAINTVRQGIVLEDVINATCHTRTYSLHVPEGTDVVRVTLAWDDPVGGAVEAHVTESLLENDLDVVLIDPLGGVHYPWLLDQKALDSAVSVFPDAAQTCGSTVNVKRQMRPRSDPYYGGYDSDFNDINPGDNKDDQIVDSDIVGATRGKDHLNNAEQIVATGMPGVWHVTVSGFKVRQGPQKFSLIGVHPFNFVPSDVEAVCRKFPALCDARVLMLCLRVPRICAAREPLPVMPGAIQLTFRDLNDRRIIQLSSLCIALAWANRNSDCDTIENSSPPRALEVVLPSEARAVGVEVFGAKGQLLAADLSDSPAKRLTVPAGVGPSFLFLRPRDRSRTGDSFRLPITVREIR